MDICICRWLTRYPKITHSLLQQRSACVQQSWHWFEFVTINGQPNQAQASGPNGSCLLYMGIDAFVYFNHLPRSSAEISQRKYPNVEYAKVSTASSDESWENVTFAPLFSPSRQARRKTRLRHLTSGRDHMGVNDRVCGSVYLQLFQQSYVISPL